MRGKEILYWEVSEWCDPLLNLKKLEKAKKVDFVK